MDPSLAMQKALRARLVAASAVTALVPAANILDKNNRPEVFPSIIIGEGQTVPGEGIMRQRHVTFGDLHIWHAEPGLVQSKAVAGAIRQALVAPLYDVDWYKVADLRIISTRFMRDPDGIHSHGVVSIEAQLVEVA